MDSLFNKVAGPATLLNQTLTQVLSFEFCKIFKNSFFTVHSRVAAFVLLVSTSHLDLNVNKPQCKRSFFQ